MAGATIMANKVESENKIDFNPPPEGFYGAV